MRNQWVAMINRLWASRLTMVDHQPLVEQAAAGPSAGVQDDQREDENRVFWRIPAFKCAVFRHCVWSGMAFTSQTRVSAQSLS